MLARRTRAALGAISLVAAPLALVAVTSSPASAADITVTTTADGGVGSLRFAVETQAVNAGGDTIILERGATYELGCTGGDLTHGSTPLTIDGAGGATIEQTCAGQRVLDQGSAPLQLIDVTLTGGQTDGPGAGVRTSGDLLVRSSTIRDNVSGTLSGGGGIASVGDPIDVVVVNSTISGNTARNGGGIGVTQGSTVNLYNSTIADNHADGGPGTGVGGAVESNGGGAFVFTLTTFAGNTANSGGGTLSIGSESEIVITGSVIADGDCSLNGNTVESAYNVTTETSCGLGDETSAVVDDVALGALGDNGGGTATMLPADDSPVVGTIPADVCAELADSDQRGEDRPLGDGCEAGSVEIVGATATPTDPDQPADPTTPPAAEPVVAQPVLTG